jgi:outer membrane lipoprotein-sorting protein
VWESELKKIIVFVSFSILVSLGLIPSTLARFERRDIIENIRKAYECFFQGGTSILARSFMAQDGEELFPFQDISFYMKGPDKVRIELNSIDLGLRSIIILNRDKGWVSTDVFGIEELSQEEIRDLRKGVTILSGRIPKYLNFIGKGQFLKGEVWVFKGKGEDGYLERLYFDTNRFLLVGVDVIERIKGLEQKIQRIIIEYTEKGSRPKVIKILDGEGMTTMKILVKRIQFDAELSPELFSP